MALIMGIMAITLALTASLDHGLDNLDHDLVGHDGLDNLVDHDDIDLVLISIEHGLGGFKSRRWVFLSWALLSFVEMGFAEIFTLNQVTH